jgi:hypothetical protein
MTSVSGDLFRTDEQRAVFAALLGKIGAGPAALYIDACVLRARPDMLIATAPFVAHALREVERAIAGRIVPVSFQACATCGRERRDTAAQMTVIASLGVLPDIELLKKLRGEANELAHRAGLQRPRSFDADFTTAVAQFDGALAAVLTSLAVPASTSATTEFLERLTTPPAILDIRPTDREREVLESLLNKAAPGPAAFYADALALQDDRFSFLFARANLIAHALREAESALRDVVLPRGFDPIKCAECHETINGHQQEIAAILHAYEIASEEEAARLWRQFADPTAADGLAGLAHKSSLDLPKPFDNATAEVFRHVTEIFATLFARFEYTFGRYIHIVDELLAAKQLRKKHEVAAFKGSIPHTDLTYDYFFTRATNPQWLVVLRDHDAFQLTPEPYRRDGALVLPAWPQGVYLRRLLETPSAAIDEIFSVFERATASANPRVHEQIVEAALLMDKERRQNIAERERAWLEEERFVPFLLGEAFGELAVVLAADDAAQLAVAMLERLLRMEVIETNDDRDLRLHVDRLAYDHLLEKVTPRIAPACGTAILSVLADALDSFSRFERPSLTAPPSDYSYIWRPAIEPHERNLRGGLREAIIDSLRDAAAEIVRAEPDKLPAVVIWLESRQWNIYRRLALHLVAESSSSDLAVDFASRPEYLGQLDLRHEMSRLIQAHAGHLREDIPEELLTIRRTLAAETTPLGGVEAFWAQEHSPLSAEEVEAMPVVSLVEFIRSWTPPPREFLSGQTHGAFAGIIRSVVTRHASEFSSAAMLFCDLRPAYIRNLLEGLDEVGQRGENIEWQPVMELGVWLADQERAAGDHRVINPFAEEETWRYVRRAFLDLLEHAMWRETPLVPAEHWRTAWHLLQRFALDPDSGDDEDAVIDADANTRSVFSALHSVSGKALSLLIRFPVILRQMRVPATDVENTRQHIFNVVESHLRAANAAAPTFTVIGHHFTDLIALDGDRARRLAAALFVPTVASRAAWSAYLMNRVRIECGALLREQYSDAIDALDANAAKASFLEENLGRHLVALYCSGEITLDDDDLIARFFTHASPALRTQALWDISGALAAAPASVLPALVALWEWCVRSLPASELRAFQAWARSGRFDEAWVLDQLLSLARRGTQLSSYLLVEYLEPIFDADPQRVTRVLATLVEHQAEEHEVHAARHAVLRIAKRAHDAGEPAQQESRRLANLMTARGFYDFKELT